MKTLIEIKKKPGRIRINGVEHHVFDQWIGIIVPVIYKEEMGKIPIDPYYIYENEDNLFKIKNVGGITVRRKELINGASFKKAFEIMRLLSEVPNEYIVLPRQSCEIIIPENPMTEQEFITFTSFNFNMDKDFLDEAMCKSLWKTNGKNVRIEKKIFLT